MKKIILSVLLFTLSFQSFSEEDDSFSNRERGKAISQGQYVVGGLAGIFPGFGIGHAIQGRYAEKGWIFTVGSFSMFAGGFGAVFFGMGAGYDSNNPLLIGAAYVFLGVMVIGVGLRIWEIVDAWMLPSHYKIVKEKPFQMKPLAFYDSNSQFHYGLSLNYQF